MTKVIGARSGDVVAQYCNRSTMLSLWSETGDRWVVRVIANGQVLMDVFVPEVGRVQWGPMDLQINDLAIQVLRDDKPKPPPPPQWATVGDVIDELLKHDREKRFQIRDWPRYFDELEDIDIVKGGVVFRETDGAVVWDVWELL